jgi:hypothetical protein
MRLARGFAGALLWVLASIVGLLGVVLCVTIILLPVGLIVLRQSRKLYQSAVRLMLPRAVAHPVKESRRKAGKSRREVGKSSRRAKRKLRKLT